MRLTGFVAKAPLVGVMLAASVLTLAAGCGGNDDESVPGQTTKSTVPFDRAFIDAMVPHHEQAIEMARSAKSAGLVESKLVNIANSIVSSQQVETAQMKEWRAAWFDSDAIDPEGGASLGLTMEQMGMSGAMDFSFEDDVDAAFAKAMTAHHQGAIEMANLALEQGQHAEIRTLAGEIVQAQQEEIDFMKRFSAGGGHGVDDVMNHLPLG